MAMPLRQKVLTVLLLLYWPGLFVLAHVPIPRLVYRAQVSDKTLHFLAHLLLVFLLWFAVRPDRKVSWRDAALWWVLFVAVWYGAFDELLQGGSVGRSCDFRDFLANLAGASSGLIVFSLFAFWPALLADHVFPKGGGDLWGQLYPVWSFVAGQVRQGIFPLWDPLLMAGLGSRHCLTMMGSRCFSMWQTRRTAFSLVSMRSSSAIRYRSGSAQVCA